MKTLKIIIFLLITIKFTAYSQQDSALKKVSVAQLTKLGVGNFYVYNDNLNKFVGTWLGRDDQRSVKIVFIKKGIRLSKQSDNLTQIEGLRGSLQYFERGVLVVAYSGDEILGGISSGALDTLNVFIDVKSRKAQAVLLASYLKDGTIKLEIEKNRFEFKNDKEFELKEPIILTKQN